MYGLPQSTYYYNPVEVSDLTHKLMNLIDIEYTAHPFYGRRKITAVLNRILEPEGVTVNIKRIDRLMTQIGIEAVYAKKRLSDPGKDAEKYPYLLRHIKPDRPNHVWATDITYIRMHKGFLYLTGIMDWYSRYLLSWELSNTLDTRFCLDALHKAFAEHGTPEIFNTDQGSQFTSREYTRALKESGVRISQDGKGRCLDNAIIERFWRTVKYEEVYLKNYTTGTDAYEQLKAYMSYYNDIRPHQSLDNATPHQIYFNTVDLKGD
jgi:putative transposase